MRTERGFSLVELMVAMAVGLLIVLALATVIANASGSHRELSAANRQLENGRYAMQVLADDLHNAGYVGPVANMSNPTALPTVNAGSCSTAASGYQSSLSPGVFLLTSRPACINANDHVSGTDILVVMGAKSITTPVASLLSGVLYSQTDTQNLTLAAAAATQADNEVTFNLTKKDGTTRADITRFRVHVYYVSPCNRFASGQTSCTSAADDGQPVPTLKRLELGSGAFSTVPVAEGIANMQIELGLDTDTDGAPDSYSTASPATASVLANVVAVGVHLLARNTETTAGYTDTKSYNLGSTAVAAANDSYKRHVFSRVVRLHNASGRRAS